MNYYSSKMGSAILNLISVTFSEHLLCLMHPLMLSLLFQEAEGKADSQKKGRLAFAKQLLIHLYYSNIKDNV